MTDEESFITTDTALSIDGTWSGLRLGLWVGFGLEFGERQSKPYKQVPNQNGF